LAKEIEVRGLDELRARMKRFPLQWAKIMVSKTAHAMLAHQAAIPPYPPKPLKSKYVRTGRLGRGLGVDMGGNVIGTPSLFQIRKLGAGAGNIIGKVGAMRPPYAPRVVGSSQQQNGFFAQYWWRFEQTIGRARQKVLAIFNSGASELARFLEGKGL